MLQRKSILLLALLAFALLVGASAASIIVNVKPTACSLCHRTEVDTWKTSTHKGVSCRNCHQRSDALGFVNGQLNLIRMSAAKLAGEERPPRARVASGQCLSCHSAIKGRVVDRNGIRMEHASVIKKTECADCHNEVVHGQAVPLPKRATMDKCTACHKGKGDELLDCQMCHSKRKERLPTSRVGFWATLHGKSWEKTHGMGNLDSCSACHSKAKCSKCHLQMPHPEGWPSDHGTVAKGDRESCAKCHKKESFCSSCHGIAMPHLDGFLKSHSTTVKKSGVQTCYKCHLKEDCSRCHERHAHPGGVVPMKQSLNP